ncbi:MAG: hypothetical protein Q9220_007071 [cf. Caloplaca sp. 1 TL-2023]
MDPLSALASVCSIIDAINKTVHYSTLARNAPKEIAKLIEELRALRTTFEDFLQLLNQTEDALDPASPGKLHTLRRVAEPNDESSTLASCEESLNRLLRGLERSISDSKALTSSAVIARLSWPFKEKEILKLVERFEKLRTKLEAGLNIDQAKLAQQIHATVQRVDERSLVREKDTLRHSIRQWLSAPDPWINHKAARTKFQKSTGEWFTKSRQYTSWKTDPNSMFWLHGTTGCGKTILASTIIDDLFSYCKKEGYSMAYYYFDFSTSDQQDYGLMLRSLLGQFAEQHSEAFALLDKMHKSSQNHPSNETMLIILKNIVRCLSNVYILLDALDECKSMPKLLRFLEVVHSWDCDGLHLMVTSQPQGDILQTLNELLDDEHITDIVSSPTEDDILCYIRCRLSEDENLKRWRKYITLRDQIESKLMQKAGGMFRWVECQLDTLGRCLSVSMLEKALVALPLTLGETYERILCNIEDDYRTYAVAAFRWLLYSERELRLHELVDVLAIDTRHTTPFDENRRLLEVEDVIRVCSSLVIIVPDPVPKRRTVKLAHHSVREYLTSSQISTGRAADFAVDNVDAQIKITAECLTYLFHTAKELYTDQHPDDRNDRPRDKIRPLFPLTLYAADMWMKHIKKIPESEELLLPLIIKAFEPEVFRTWYMISHEYQFRSVESCSDSIRRGLTESTNTLRLRCAIQAGLHLVVQRLLDDFCADVNGRNDKWTFPKEAAPRNGEEETVKLLHDSRPDGILYFDGTNALQEAASKGNVKIIELLLSYGAKPEACEGQWEKTALWYAASSGHDRAVEVLLDHGADVNMMSKEGRNQSALMAACSTGSLSTIRYLISRGADVNLYNDNVGTALQRAVYSSHASVAQLLIDSGANVHMDVSRGKGSLLSLACHQGDYQMVDLLLRHGARDTIPSSDWLYGCAFEAAVQEGHDAVVQLLLDSSAQMSTNVHVPEDSLQLASIWGHTSIVHLLLNRGWDVNDGRGEYGSPLQAAAASGEDSVVMLLLENGADVHRSGGMWGTPLQAAFGGLFVNNKCPAGFKAPRNSIACRDRYWSSVAHLLAAGAHRTIDENLKGRLKQIPADPVNQNTEQWWNARMKWIEGLEGVINSDEELERHFDSVKNIFVCYTELDEIKFEAGFNRWRAHWYSHEANLWSTT